MVLLKDCIQESANYEVTRSVAARIEKKANILESNTFFVREGDLLKRNRSRSSSSQYRYELEYLFKYWTIIVWWTACIATTKYLICIFLSILYLKSMFFYLFSHLVPYCLIGTAIYFRFFLFSDTLLYTHLSSLDNKYKVRYRFQP